MLETVWNGTMDRKGECQSLTSYRGASSLNNAPQEERLTDGEIHEIQLALGAHGRQPRPKRGAWRSEE
jgi:hypothetical protein